MAGESVQWNEIEELSLLKCPVEVGDRIWFRQKPEEIGEETWVTDGNQVCMEIGTITAVDGVQISILLLSGHTATVTHENEEREVNRHNAIVTRVGEAKKAVAAATLANIDPWVPKGTVEPDHQDVVNIMSMR